ncbi:DUF1249 domain-containing protein [Shewanella sp. MF05960]|uniref:DUF1249 domain-containing protein n=1 Tax=Shewanella sp. MF05960 TaxID=3434874 RepID=UPI003D798FE5
MTVSNHNKKQKYQPNVSAFLAVCGRNYAHILKWLPEQFSLNEPWPVEGEFGTLIVNIVENTKYTQLVEISRPIPNGHFFKSPKALVRVYHDAQLAEVLTSQQIYRLKPVYDYPNIHMHHSDEKFQVNAFLEDLLKIGARRVACQS